MSKQCLCRMIICFIFGIALMNAIHYSGENPTVVGNYIGAIGILCITGFLLFILNKLISGDLVNEKKQKEDIDRLKSCMEQIGFECFIKEGTPELIVKHMHEIAKTNLDYQKILENKIRYLEKKLEEKSD